jgi:uncharacterized sulfatase
MGGESSRRHSEAGTAPGAHKPIHLATAAIHAAVAFKALPLTLARTGQLLTMLFLAIGPLSSVCAQRFTVGPNQEVPWSQGPDVRRTGEQPPNIVLIVVDDLGWNDLTFNGGGIANGSVPTPHIDSLARDGVMFRNAYAACATCAPSRAAILSGRYPTRFGFEFTPTPTQMVPMFATLAPLVNMKPPPLFHLDRTKEGQLNFADLGMPTEEVTLAETLKAADYHTVHIGKWHLGHAVGMWPRDQGFDESLNMHSGLYLPEKHPDAVNSRQRFDPIDQFLWLQMQYAASFNGGAPFEPRGYLTDYYNEEAVKVIERNRNRPFFLYLAHWAPHIPLQAKREDYDALAHIKDHTERVYAAMIRSLDRGIGTVLQALREHGLEENTLVVFTSDNGGAGYVGLPGLNRPYRGWKMTFFEGGVHVPMFMRWPKHFPKGVVYEKPVHHFDIYTTAAAAANASLPDDRPMDGVDLATFVSKGSDRLPHDRMFWRSGDYQVVMARGWKLHRSIRPKKNWLFDMVNDPTEQNNVVDSHPEKVRELLGMLEEHNRSQKPAAWPCIIENPVRIDKTLRDKTAADDEYVYWEN